jgi:hypothetical protein
MLPVKNFTTRKAASRSRTGGSARGRVKCAGKVCVTYSPKISLGGQEAVIIVYVHGDLGATRLNHENRVELGILRQYSSAL